MLRTAGYECNALWEHKAILQALVRIEEYDLLFCQVSALEEEEKLLTWALGAGKDMPIVATAGRTPGCIPKVIYERCNFLQAPFDREQLLAIVRDALNTHE
jgi:DNA-binding NtrC family response regulator